MLSYVEALRDGRVNLPEPDMRRAASLAAVEAVSKGGVPREIELGVLRGILKNEADNLPFSSASNSGEVPPDEVFSALFTSGILIELRLRDTARFTYDPVAEILAKRWKAKRTKRAVSGYRRLGAARNPPTSTSMPTSRS